MHYIRLLRPPAPDPAKGRLGLVFTITTDLGDSFLCPAEPIAIAVHLETSKSDGSHATLVLRPAPGSGSSSGSGTSWWRAGMRVSKLELAFPPALARTLSARPARLCIRPRDEPLVASTADDILATSEGLIMPVHADLVAPGAAAPASVCTRRLRLGAGPSPSPSPPADGCLEVEEDMGESIARHVWDAGVVAACVVAGLCRATSASASASASAAAATRPVVLPATRALLRGGRALNVLELGCGVGVLGLAAAAALSSSSSSSSSAVAAADGPQPHHVLLTDLPEAEARARANMARNAPAPAPDTAAAVTVDYENLDWEAAGRRGDVGPLARARRWDLVVLSDCTYNADVLPALARTLSVLHALSSTSSAGVAVPECRPARVLLATKPRHPSEQALFGLMAAGGWSVAERAALPLPVLAAGPESVEIYLFQK